MRCPYFSLRINPSRRLALAAALFGAVTLSGGAVHAQNATVKLMVGFPAGGATDILARTLAEK